MCEPQSTKINTVTTKCNNMIELHVLRVFNKANYAKTSPMINLVCDLQNKAESLNMGVRGEMGKK